MSNIRFFDPNGIVPVIHSSASGGVCVLIRPIIGEKSLMFRRMPLFDVDDAAPSDAWSRWGLGVALPSLVATFGTSCIIYQQAVLIGQYGRRMSLTGWDAVAFGIAILAVSLFLHAHYFWSTSERSPELAELGKVAALVLGIVSISFVIVRNFSPI